MNNIIIDLFRGNSDGFERCYLNHPQYEYASSRLEQLERDMETALPDGLKAMFCAYRETAQEVSNFAAEQDFLAGYRFGMRLMLAALSNEFAKF